MRSIEITRNKASPPSVEGHGQEPGHQLRLLACREASISKTRWWQLKYSLFSPRKLGKIPILTNIFQMG